MIHGTSNVKYTIPDLIDIHSVVWNMQKTFLTSCKRRGYIHAYVKLFLESFLTLAVVQITFNWFVTLHFIIYTNIRIINPKFSLTFYHVRTLKLWFPFYFTRFNLKFKSLFGLALWPRRKTYNKLQPKRFSLNIVKHILLNNRNLPLGSLTSEPTMLDIKCCRLTNYAILTQINSVQKG